MNESLQDDIIFIGSFVPTNSVLHDNRISIAGNNFQHKFIDFLNIKKSVSLIPIFLNTESYKCFKHNNAINYIGRISLFNFQLPKKVSILLELIYASIYLTFVNYKIVYFYNLTLHNILLVFFTTFILRKNVIVIVADYSNYNNTIKDKIFNYLLRNINGIISLNNNIKCNPNNVLIHGLIKSIDISRPDKNDNRKNILLSGSLGETTGLFIALEFAKSSPNYNLHICGRPFRIDTIKYNKIVADHLGYPNITFYGVLDNHEYYALLRNCSICLSLRNPNDIEHQFNFPSKILEYLSFSKIVVSTLNYAGLPENLLYKVDYNSESIAKTIDFINSLNFNKVNEIMFSSSQYIIDNFTENAVRNKLKNLHEKFK